jgi:hypothetical protein
MRLVPPITVTSAALTSNVPETPPDEWLIGDSYDEGDQASVLSGIDDTTATIYESLIDANVGNDPVSSPDEWKLIAAAHAVHGAGPYAIGARVTDATLHKIYESLVGSNSAPLTDTESWAEVGPSNRVAMFDDKPATQTTREGTISATVEIAGRADTIGVVNCDCASINVTVHDETGVTELFNQDFPMVSTAGITNWWRWFFAPIVRERALYVSGLPNVSNPRITVTASGTGMVSIGNLDIGWQHIVGGTELGFGVGITEYSEKQKDQFGTYFYNAERGYSDRGQFTVEIDRHDFDWVNRLLTDQRGKPMLILGSELHRSAIYHGVIWDWELKGFDPKPASLSVRIEGL